MDIRNLLIKRIFLDKKFRKPRMWSNRELKKFAHLFQGRIINVSAWQDQDKEGNRYKDYFKSCFDYWISNYKNEARGFQGNISNEIFLNLEEEIHKELIGKFDVVFSHTVLEHIFNIFIAFENLCKMSNDIVIIIVPFLQEQHAAYGDYWRFTPLTINKLFETNKMNLIYINYNDYNCESIYIFAIGSKKREKWNIIFNDKLNKLRLINNVFLGTKIIKNSLLGSLYNNISYLIDKIKIL